MKKIKQFSLKAMLLTILAALTIGFTGCSDELSGDQTQGKPGYLTLNLRTIKPKQTKFTGANATDYATVKDFNVFVVDGDNILFSKYVKDGVGGVTLSSVPAASNSVTLQVGNLPASAKVVVIANWGSRITDETTLTGLKAKTVTTVDEFDADNGLVMTGEGAITASGLSYTSAVTVSPVSSKITVKWNTTTGSEVDQYFDITGIYIVNAIKQTTLPIVGGTTINSLIVPTTKLVSTGYDYSSLATPLEYHLYGGPGLTLDATSLSDVASQIPQNTAYHYYVGENYHRDIPTTAGGGAIYNETTTNNSNANTLILIEATPNGAGEAIYGAGARYYTYALSNAITNNAFDYGMAPAGTPIITGWTAVNGFSTKRKTNYIVNFTLDNPGTLNPFEQIRTLTVTVTATGWEPATPTGPSF